MKLAKKAIGGLILAVTLFGVDVKVEKISINVTIQVVVFGGK